MAIQVSGVNVIDDQRNLNVGILTATSVDVPPQAISFSPSDGSSDVSLTSNIVITFNVNVSKGSGNITLREGSASGTVIETIAVSSGSVSISGGAVTINPSDFPTGKDIYVVVDDGAFESSSLGSGTELINTYNFTTGPITTSSFSPSDGATGQSVSTNIVITFSENITKGSGNITIRSGSASGTAQQTISVSSGSVSVSGTQATINPPSDLAYETDTYIVVDSGCFRNADGDVASGNATINTYNFTTETDIPPLGDAFEGGYLICTGGSSAWIVSPTASTVCRTWHSRYNAVSQAQNCTGCSGWFVPSCSQLKNPGFQCRTYWPETPNGFFWSNSTGNSAPDNSWAMRLYVNTLGTAPYDGPRWASFCVRAFRTVTY